MMRTTANRQFKVEFLSFFRNFLRNSLELSFVCRTLAVFCFLAVVATSYEKNVNFHSSFALELEIFGNTHETT